MKRDRAYALLALCLLQGCQAIGSFEDFEAASTVSGADGGDTSCVTDAFTCNGAKLMRCDAQDGLVMVEECASEPLCQRGREEGVCVMAACGEGTDEAAAKCEGGALLTCSADQQSYDETACDPEQCNPLSQECFSLDMDATEVTRKAYADFLAENPATDNQPAGCEWNTSLAPDETCMADAGVCQGEACGEHPQPCVDWCDALAYCQAQDRTLCGLIGGDMLPLDQYANAGRSAWMNACSSGGQYIFVHGDEWEAASQGQACNGAAKAKGENGMTFEVGTLDECQSSVAAYAEFFDLSGNLAEWENSCSTAVDLATAGKEDTCRVRGGSFESNKTFLRCDADAALQARSATSPSIGFRCCGSTQGASQ